MPVLSPGDYHTLSPKDLLQELAAGRIGFDHSFLDAFLADRAAAEEALVAFVEADHDEDVVDIEDQVFDLFRHLRTPKALDFYLLQLRVQVDGVEDPLIEAFSELGAPAVEPLLQLYNELEEEESGEVAFVLAALQVSDPRITELLLSRLEYDAQDAAICLGIHGDPAAKPALEQLLSEIKDRPEADLLRIDVEEAISRVSETRETVEHPPFNLKEFYDEFQPPFFESMEPAEAFEWIDSSDPRIRIALAESLEDADLSEALVREIANRASTDEDSAVRCALWRCLMPVESTETLLPLVQSRFEADAVEDVERATLAIVLAKLKYTPAVKAKINEFYQDSGLRPLALEAMWYTSDKDFLPLVQAHLEDADLDARRAAILGIGFFVDTSSASRLIPSMSDANLRSDAIYSYALAHPGEVSRITAQKVLKHVEQVAGSLDGEETEMAMSAIDLRLGIQGIRPFFAESDGHHGHQPHTHDEDAD